MSSYANRKQNAFIAARKRGFRVKFVRSLFDAFEQGTVDYLRESQGLSYFEAREAAKLLVSKANFHWTFPQFFKPIV